MLSWEHCLPENAKNVLVHQASLQGLNVYNSPGSAVTTSSVLKSKMSHKSQFKDDITNIKH